MELEKIVSIHPATYARWKGVLAAASDYTRARPILEDLWQRRKGPGSSIGVFSANEAAPLIAKAAEGGYFIR